ncbi:MAG: antibiotic biosynthesis monooxygenase family protein [Acidobacteriaceae bacterium]
MSKEIVRFAVDLSIHEGRLDEFESIARTMIAGTQNEPGALHYDWCFSNDHRRCRILETYRDSEAVLAHMTGAVVQVGVPRMLEVSSINRFEVYGDPGPKAARMLANVGAEIFDVWEGISR